MNRKAASDTGDADYCNRWSRSAGVSQSVTRAGCAKMAERTEVLFGVKTPGGQRNTVLDGSPMDLMQPSPRVMRIFNRDVHLSVTAGEGSLVVVVIKTRARWYFDAVVVSRYRFPTIPVLQTCDSFWYHNTTEYGETVDDTLTCHLYLSFVQFCTICQ